MHKSEFYDGSYDLLRSKSFSKAQLLDQSKREAIGYFQWVIEEKNKYFPHLEWNQLKIAELGGGVGGLSILLAREGANVTLVDFSSIALELSQELALLEGVTVNTLQADLSFPDIDLKDQFHILVDSHLMHCLCLKPERISYYECIKKFLRRDGIFMAETMVHRKKMFIPSGFQFDEENILWQKIGSWVSVRKIIDSLDLEKEVVENELKIKSFYYYAQFSFAPHESFYGVPPDLLPASVRMILAII